MCALTMGACAWDRKVDGIRLTPAAAAAWEVFGVAGSQWNVGMNGATGLRYEGLEAGARMAGLEMTPRVFRLVRLIEDRRLAIWSEEAAAAAAARKNPKE